MIKSDMRKILVTGGSGFIGAHVVQQMLDKGYDVTNIDIATPSQAQHMDRWIELDIRHAENLRDAFARVAPDGVIHLAAKAEMEGSWADFNAIHAGTANMLAAMEATPSVRRFLNISTQLVIEPGYTPRSALDFRPYTTYGEAKAYAEALVLQWQSPIDWLTVRPTNIWGPQHPLFAESIWRYLQSRAYLHPTGAPVHRSYGYVENCAQQIVGLFEADPARTARQVFYSGDGVMDSAIWADAFAVALTGKAARRVPKWSLKGLGKAGDVMKALNIRFPFDSGRAHRMTQSYPTPLETTFDLVGQPPVPLEVGVERTVEWLRALPNFAPGDR